MEDVTIFIMYTHDMYSTHHVRMGDVGCNHHLLPYKKGKDKKKIKRDNIDFVRKLSDCLVWFNMWPKVDFCV